ncbi:MAG: RCC1 domain-containing protein [Chloroflexota bacterium]|jgi:alpha-tubulin suppressor-like RCC1 family protein
MKHHNLLIRIIMLLSVIFANNMTTPRPIEAATATMIVSGQSHSCALMSGQVWCWGDNSKYQLGNGTNVKSLGATRVKMVNGTYLSNVSRITIDTLDRNGTCAIRYTSIYCWGEDKTYATPILNDNGTIFTGVSKLVVGSTVYCVLKNAQVLCWNKNSTPSSAQLVKTKSAILSNVSDFQGALNHFCALVNQSVWCWGDESLGSGTVDTSRSYADRVQVSTGGYLQNVKLISVSGVNACAVTNNNLVLCWGENDDFESCISGVSYLYKATKTSDVCQSKTTIRKLSSGYFHTCTVANGVYCWGYSKYKQTYPSWGWTKFVNTKVLDVGLGTHHTCATKIDEVWCWGINDEGQLGDGTVNSIQPQPASRVIYSNYRPFR